MKSNENLQKDVQSAIRWEPLLSETEIGVIAKDGVITLTGVVDSYAKKMEVENAAKNVSGVKAVAETIEVRYNSPFKKNDTEIAHEILNAWKWTWEVPNDQIKVQVEDGWVTLEGEVEWNYQKQAARKAVENLTGVKGVSNNIAIGSRSKDLIEKKAVEHALARSWFINAQDVHVNVVGNKVKLTGSVHSLYQKEEAARLAWNAPGVFAVDNELAVEHN
jgi:osmotically-inducible protein OsmY